MHRSDVIEKGPIHPTRCHTCICTMCLKCLNASQKTEQSALVYSMYHIICKSNTSYTSFLFNYNYAVTLLGIVYLIDRLSELFH